MTTQTKDLNMIAGGVPSVVNVSQFDTGNTIEFTLYNNASLYEPPEGTSVRVEGRKLDGNGFSYNATLSGSKVTVTLTEQMTVISGSVMCELRLSKDSVDIGTANFILAVEESPINENTPISDTEIPAIVELARQEQYTAEAWAVGTRNGKPVSSDDPAYHNNAKYYGSQPAADISYYEQNGFLSRNLFDVSKTVLGITPTGTVSAYRATSAFIDARTDKNFTIKDFSNNLSNDFFVSVLQCTKNSITNQNSVDSLGDIKTSSALTVTVGANYNYLCLIYVSASSAITQATVDSLQIEIEKGSTATDYIPYAPSNTALDANKAEISSIGTDESGRTTASKAYAQGDYFYKDGYICKALASIAQGATFTLNTNYQTKTLAEILASIEAQL